MVDKYQWPECRLNMSETLLAKSKSTHDLHVTSFSWVTSDSGPCHRCEPLITNYLLKGLQPVCLESDRKEMGTRGKSVREGQACLSAMAAVTNVRPVPLR